MKKVPFKKLKQEVLEEEIETTKYTYKDEMFQGEDIIKDLREEFKDIECIEDLVDWLIGCGFNHYEAYEYLLSIVVQDTKKEK